MDLPAGRLAAARAEIGLADDLMEDVLIRPLPELMEDVELEDNEFGVGRIGAPFVVEVSLNCLRFAGDV